MATVIAKMIDPEQLLIDQIAANQNAPEVPADEYRIAIPGYSELAVRKRGAFVLSGVLTDPQTKSPVDVFYCDGGPTAAKLSASHPMVPVGPYDGPGGQHGPARWADFELLDTFEGHTASSMRLRAIMPGPVSFTRNYELHPTELVTISRIHARQGEEALTSLGHHDYYTIDNEADIHEMTINGQTLDELLNEGGASEAILAGEPRFWRGFSQDSEDGRALVRFPDGRLLYITAATDVVSRDVGMLLWHRPGPSICLEPTVGVVESDGVLNTRALHLGGTGILGATLDVSTILTAPPPSNC